MAEKRCGLGFSCALMMQQSRLQAENCPNLNTCGDAQRLEPSESWFSVAVAGDRPRLPIIYGTTRSGKSVIASASTRYCQSQGAAFEDGQLAERDDDLLPWINPQ